MILKRSQKIVHKKALIISYYWPPAGGPGVQRWLKFVKYLPKFGIEPIVFIPEKPNYPILDESLQAEVEANITILKQPINEPYKYAKYLSKNRSNTMREGIIKDRAKQSLIDKLLLYIRGNMFIPDARIGWVKPSVAFLSEYLNDNSVDAIITTDTPHSLHLIGLHLKNRLGIKWIADFRDPWTTIGYHKELMLGRRAKKRHKQLESDVLQAADQIIVTSWVTKQEFLKLADTPIQVITNGFDDFEDSRVTRDERFSLSHIGSFLSKRNPLVLWETLNEIISENADFKSKFQLNLVGTTSEIVLESLDKFNLTNYINDVGYVSYKESVKFQKK